MGIHTHTIDYSIPPTVGQYPQPIILKVPKTIRPSRDHLHLVVEAFGLDLEAMAPGIVDGGLAGDLAGSQMAQPEPLSNWMELAGQLDGNTSCLNGWKRMDYWMER